MTDDLSQRSGQAAWPPLPLSDWADTCATLQLWMQIVGKICLTHAPMLNHWWQVPLYVTCRGLTTSPIPYRSGTRHFQIDFDFIAHRLELKTSDGASEMIPLAPRTVADFYADIMARLHRLGLETRIWTMPVEIEAAVPFDQDRNACRLRPRAGPSVLAHSRAGRPGLHPFSVPLPRQGESGALLLGQLRHGGYALFRAPGTATGKQIAQRRGMGDDRGLLA